MATKHLFLRSVCSLTQRRLISCNLKSLNSSVSFSVSHIIMENLELRKDPKFIALYEKIHGSKEFDLEQAIHSLRLVKQSSSEAHRVFHYEAMMGLVARIVEDNGEKYIAIAPKVEGRIRFI